MSDVSNSFSAWETLPEDEPPLCIAVRRPESLPRHYEVVNRCRAVFFLMVFPTKIIEEMAFCEAHFHFKLFSKVLNKNVAAIHKTSTTFY